MSESLYSYDLTDAGQFGFDGFSQFSAHSHERRYHLDDSQLASPYGHTLPHTVADLLDIAASIMWADRHSPRARTHGYGTFRQSRGWSRQFHLTLGVRTPDLWNQVLVKEKLEQLLTWLTEDVWHLHFEQQPLRRFTDIRPSLFSSPQNDTLVVLYSGGLDSLAGTVSLLQKYPEKPLMLVSATSPRLNGVLTRQTNELQRHFGPNRIQHSHLPFYVVHDKSRTRKGEEHTQRARGFLFFAFGIAEAVACGASRVLTCENGVGMLNLPLNKRQLGTQHTRAMHPRTVEGMSQLLSALGLSPLQCEAPHLLRTKGELCLELRNVGLSSLCSMTISCDSFPLRLPADPTTPNVLWHCGECTSCILRRQAIFAAHLEADDIMVPYKYDVCSSPQGRKLSYLEPLKMMLDQVTLLEKACTSFKPETALVREFPELLLASRAVERTPDAFGLQQKTGSIEAFVRLFDRYAKEWSMFPYRV